jgi:dihydroorotate dehydrogenase
LKAFRNRSGVPNPGIDHLLASKPDLTQIVVSIAGRTTAEYLIMFGKLKAAGVGGVELNVSCNYCPPELGQVDFQEILKTGAIMFGPELIVKLPPVEYDALVALSLQCGVRSFHCSNALSTAVGGISGKPLMPLSLDAIRRLRVMARTAGVKLHHVIGGGGVTCHSDAMQYLRAGANSVSISSGLWFFWKWRSLKHLACQLQHQSWPPKPGNLTLTLKP